jgi:hypothetical protein
MAAEFGFLTLIVAHIDAVVQNILLQARTLGNLFRPAVSEG